ncbi:MAG: cupin domain-containing protein [Geminicoccaceae bacterium]|nr:cupin domain-containing protein [Geminicoccaceae bacterium]MCX8100144.1 cupin domain-containing protein [Geminicoccaceae bacterium]MDW8369258.1 cupin domain-containing protein [Geminicoccaceae bacterium]
MAELPVFPAFVAAPGIHETIRLPGLGIEHHVRVPSAATGGQLCLIEEITAPGAGPPRHVHKLQTEVFAFLEGDYLVEIDGQSMPAPAGTVVVIPPGRPHAFKNRGSTPGRFLFLLTPAGDTEGFFRKLAAILAEGPPDPERLNRELAAFGFEVTGPPMA